MKRVLVLHAQIPFQRGGAEALAEGLVAAINREMKDVRAELVQLPFKWYPEEQILSDMMAWRMLDLTEAAGEKIDLVIGTKFPSYAAQHPNKVIWLVHQHRVLYDLQGKEIDKPVLSPHDLVVRRKIRAADEAVIRESKKVFTISGTVSERLQRFNGIASTPIAPPSLIAHRIQPGEYGDSIACIARIDSLKRQHLLIEAIAKCPKAKAVIVGGGHEGYRKSLESLIEKHQLQERCHLTGFVSEDALLQHLANARAVFYGPLDEDYGYAAIEGFLAQKPVITCDDSGEVKNFVQSTGSGWVVPSTADAIAEAINKVYAASPQELQQRAEAGLQFAKSVTWQHVLDEIVVPFL